MSNQEPESVSERELAQMLQEELFSGKPRSVGEALEAAEEPEPPAEPEPEEEEEGEPVPAPPVVVTDEPRRDREEPEEAAVLEELEEEPEPEPELEEAPHLAWAKKKYGDDSEKWAKAAFDLEQITTRLGNEKREAEQLAAQWYEYAQQAEAQAATTQQAGMPLSAQEEAWVEQALANPYGYARQAIMNGNVPLHNAILERVAEEAGPMVATQIGTQIQMELQQLAQQEQAQAQQEQPSLVDALQGSFQRLGLELGAVGPKMLEKVSELGEYHPYVQAMIFGDDGQRDLAVQAVYDLVRAGTLTTRKVRDEARAEQIKRESELRKQAAGVVTGAPHTPPPQEDPFLAAMTEEWKTRRQWGGE